MKWAEIVYGRTLEVDFRFLAAPDENRQQVLAWAEPYILVSTRMAEKLSEQPRWLFVRGEQFCLIGITCMARELIAAASDPTLEAMGCDNHGCPLFLFAGYIARVGKEDLILPSYEALDLPLFAPLYRFVAEHWDVKPYNPKSREPISTHFQAVPLLEEEVRTVPNQTVSEDTKRVFNTNPHYVGIFPNNDVEKQDLWLLATASKKPTSLCIGLNRQRDAMDGLFLNVTVDGVTAAETLPLQSAEQSASALPPKSQSTIDTHSQSDWLMPRGDKLVAAGVSAGVGIWIANTLSIPVLPTMVILGGISYVGMSFFDSTNKKRSSHNMPPPQSDNEESFGLKPKSSAAEKPDNDQSEKPNSPWQL
ncbi:MAG: hypothetical protein WCJ03_07150 [Bacteroidales bacterium]